MTIGSGISHNNTIHIIQVQVILLYKCHKIQTKGSQSRDKLQINPLITYSR
jgi:hypothetical protein